MISAGHWLSAAIRGTEYLVVGDDRTIKALPTPGHLQFIEVWLPLAQEENRIHGWGYDPPGLEDLIMDAADALAQSHTSLAARAVLWYYHRRKQQQRPTEL